MKKEKSCRDCLLGFRINVNGDILCRLKGAVSPDYCCPRHRPSPVRVVLLEENFQKCLNCQFFITEGVSPEQSDSVGFCQLFTVRTFNGSEKKACSKYCPKSGQGESKTG